MKITRPASELESKLEEMSKILISSGRCGIATGLQIWPAVRKTTEQTSKSPLSSEVSRPHGSLRFAAALYTSQQRPHVD